METVHIQLPAILMEQIKQKLFSEEAINQAFSEAIQMWLEKQSEIETKEKALQMLRQAGLVMTSGRQRTFAEAIITTLHPKDVPTHAKVKASLAKLKTPLSEEIINMRGER